MYNKDNIIGVKFIISTTRKNIVYTVVSIKGSLINLNYVYLDRDHQTSRITTNLRSCLRCLNDGTWLVVEEPNKQNFKWY